MAESGDIGNTTDGESIAPCGQVYVHGRPLKYIVNHAGGKMFLLQDFRDVFFLTETWLRKRLETVRVPLVLTAKDQTAKLREAGLVASNTSRVSVFPASSLDKVLADVTIQPYMSTAQASLAASSQCKSPTTSLSDDALTTLKLKRMQSLLRSDLVGRDVNCIQAPVRTSVSSETKQPQLAPLARSPESNEDVMTRTRVVKRPQRLCDYDQQSSASESADPECPAAKRKRDSLKQYTGSVSAICDGNPHGLSPCVSPSLMDSSHAPNNNNSNSLVVKFQRQYSPEHEAMQWVVPMTGPERFSHRQPLASAGLYDAPSADHFYASTSRSATQSVSSACDGGSALLAPPLIGSGIKTTAKGKVRGASTSKQKYSKSSSSSLPTQAQQSSSQGPGGHLPSAFSLNSAIPETRPRLLVRDSQLVEAVTFSSFLGKGRVPPADHPVWRWKVGASVRKEHYSLRFTAA